MNKVELIGRLTHDVEMRQTPNGVSLARFSIAVTPRFKNSNGEYDADFINCVAFGRQGEFAEKYFRKGIKIAITGEFIANHFQKGGMIAVVGSIQSRSWDGNDGKKQYATEVVVDEVYFTGAKKQNNNNQQQTPPQDNSDYYSDPDFPELDYPDESV